MTISVIIPAFNAERFIAEALASVLAQSLEPSEVIVINDATARISALPEAWETTLEIEALRREVAGGRNPKDAKVMLAKEITARFHSAAAADAAEQDFINRSKGGVPDEIPDVRLALGEGGAPLSIAAVLKQAGLAPSSSEANRLIDGAGVRVDGGVVSDKGLKLGAGTYVVQVGKRKFARVTLGG